MAFSRVGIVSLRRGGRGREGAGKRAVAHLTIFSHGDGWIGEEKRFFLIKDFFNHLFLLSSA